MNMHDQQSQEKLPESPIEMGGQSLRGKVTHGWWFITDKQPFLPITTLWQFWYERISKVPKNKAISHDSVDIFVQYIPINPDCSLRINFNFFTLLYYITCFI